MKIGGNNFIFDYLYQKSELSHIFTKKSRNQDQFFQIKKKSRKSRLADNLREMT